MSPTHQHNAILQLYDATAYERVLLFDEEMEVEGAILFDTRSDYWMAVPDDATWRDLPVPRGSAAETA